MVIKNRFYRKLTEACKVFKLVSYSDGGYQGQACRIQDERSCDKGVNLQLLAIVRACIYGSIKEIMERNQEGSITPEKLLPLSGFLF